MGINAYINKTASYTHTSPAEAGRVMLAGRGYGENYFSLREQGFTPEEIASYKKACAASVTDERMARHIPILNRALLTK